QRMKDLEILGGEAYGRSRAEGMVTPSASPDVIDLAARIAAQTRPQGLFNATRALQLADARPLYARLTIPTLVIFGAEDQVVRPELSEELRRLTPFAQHVVLPGVGHAPYLEDPAAYTGAITAFLETHAHAES
ncbi:MAG TPA: alpha/beta hydrolase, partial [Telmatospirillum sp.]|nr:alpha/beta hydrolase [Telmatospirillum sp.]